jgi:hypothetical protein
MPIILISHILISMFYCIINPGQRHATVFSKDSYKVLIFVRSQVELRAVHRQNAPQPNINGWPDNWT